MKKLGLGYLILLIMVVVTSIFTYATLLENKEINTKIATIYEPSKLFLNNLYACISKSKMLIKTWVFIDIHPNAAEKIALNNLHGKEFIQIKDTLAILCKSWTPSEQKMFVEICKSVKDTLFVKHQEIMNTLCTAQDYAHPQKIMLSMFMVEDEDAEIMRVSNSILQHLTLLIKLQSNKVEEAKSDMETSFLKFQHLIISLGIVLLIALLLISLYSARSIVSPIKKLIGAVEELKYGNLDVQVCVNSNDETQILAEMFNKMTESLKENQENLQTAYKNLEIKNAVLETTMQEIAESREMLHESNVAKDKFFSIIAHDLRNPFNTLMTISKLLLDKFETIDNPKRIEYIKSIYQSSENTYNLLNNLLEWARTQTGKIKKSLEVISLHQVVGESVLLLQSAASKKNIRLQNFVAQSLHVYADLNMLNTIIGNLVSNAIKFTNVGGKIMVEAFVEDDFVIISVTDTGVGIEQKNIDKLFRTDTNYSTKGTAHENGTGLGLILCKEFVEENNGKIWAESQIEKGSKFIFTLPYVSELDSEDIFEDIPIESIEENPIEYPTLIPNLSDEAITKIPELISIIDQEYTPLYNTILLNNSFKEIQYFGDSLKKIGDSFAFNFLADYGAELIIASENFNVCSIENLLKDFPKFKEQLLHILNQQITEKTK